MKDISLEVLIQIFFLQGYSYVGTGTEIKIRDKIGDDKL